MKSWLNHDFSLYPDERAFNEWFKDLKKNIKDQLGSDYSLINFSPGHFISSGFIKNLKNQKLVYISFSDVRYFNNEWYTNVLIRSAKDSSDFSGGSNQYCTLPELMNKVEVITDAR